MANEPARQPSKGPQPSRSPWQAPPGYRYDYDKFGKPYPIPDDDPPWGVRQPAWYDPQGSQAHYDVLNDDIDSLIAGLNARRMVAKTTTATAGRRGAQIRAAQASRDKKILDSRVKTYIAERSKLGRPASPDDPLLVRAHKLNADYAATMAAAQHQGL